MLQNIRVDIIYYRTPTDFEMEFNLGGCCRMRLLTDKATERKGLVSGLAKAVSRSKVIIGCGPLFGEDGTISVTATAIGHKLEAVDNAKYGIKSDGEISIIKGAVPLVTSGGLFGGCIIESGPQTIILLTENKSLRKQLMNELIHPYLEELSIGAQTSVIPAEKQETPQEIVEEAADEIPEETVEEAVEALEEESDGEAELAVDDVFLETELEDEHNIIFKMDDETDEADVTEIITEPEMSAADEAIDESEPAEPEVKEPEFVPSNNGVSFYFDDDEPMPVGKKLNIPIIVLSIMLALIIAVIVYLIVVVPILNGQSISEYLRSLFSAVEGKISV